MANDAPIESILALLDRLDARMVNGVPVDNVRTLGLRLVTHPDGSGAVEALLRRYDPDESETEAKVAAMASGWDQIIEFDSLNELHGALLAATTATRRGGDEE